MNEVNRPRALERIEDYFEAFRAAVEKCRMEDSFVAADWQDAYNRFARLRDRYKREISNLTRSERQTLAKAFERDKFVEGAMKIRQIAEHVRNRDEFVILSPNNVPIRLDSNSSAAAVFSASPAYLTDVNGNTHCLDHLKVLQELEWRVSAAINRAKQALPTKLGI